MAGRLAYTLDERAVSEAVLDAINNADTTAIANAILDDPLIAPCIDRRFIQAYDLADVLAYAIPAAIGKDAITDSIMMYFQDLKFSSENPVPEPSPILDATMLREQILGTSLIRFWTTFISTDNPLQPTPESSTRCTSTSRRPPNTTQQKLLSRPILARGVSRRTWSAHVNYSRPARRTWWLLCKSRVTGRTSKPFKRF